MATAPTRARVSRSALFGLLAILAIVIGCGQEKPSPPSNPSVVVYCALDREFSEPILKTFERETGIAVLAKYDVESTKSVGLAEQILREQNRPRCDVLWNNEVINTIRLNEAGALEPYMSPAGNSFPASFRDPQGRWHGLAARARVLLINTNLLAPTDAPKRLDGLTDPKWRGKIAIAKPLFGTTATQAACLFAKRSAGDAKEFFRALKQNEVAILAGNKQVAVEVGRGGIAMGLTDTDDALAELRQKRPVQIVWLDQGESDEGMLLIPNTVAIVRGGPNPEPARRLVDFILSAQVEEELARGPSGQIPLNKAVTVRPDLSLPGAPKFATVDFAAAAKAWDETMSCLRDEFTGP